MENMERIWPVAGATEDDADLELVTLQKAADDLEEQEQEESESPILKLPEVALVTVLQQFLNQTSLQNCRLVCPEWNQIIEDSTLVMKKITIPIWHVKPFLDLLIVQNGKVKSISFRNTSPLEEKYKDIFKDTIRNTVEKVEFAFVKNTLQRKELIKLILEECTNLRELKFISEKAGIFRSITASTSTAGIASLGKISIISIREYDFGKSDAHAIIKFLLQFPNLTEIRITLSCWHDQFSTIIFDGLYNYLVTYKNNLNLKKLYFEEEANGWPALADDIDPVIPLLSLCAKHRILVEMRPRDINFNNLLDLREVSSNRPIFPTRIGGKLKLKGSQLVNLDRLQSLNIESLHLDFERDIVQGELDWIRNLQYLGGLSLSLHILPRLGLCLVTELDEVFSVGVPSVEYVSLYDNISTPTHAFRFWQYFPNLAHLYLHDWEIAPDNLISDLTILESLSYLEFHDMPFTDNGFTQQCINRFGNGRFAPAISCFKSLRELKLMFCRLLTDECVINGISKCTNLKKVYIFGCRNLTEQTCEDLVQCDEFHFHD